MRHTVLSCREEGWGGGHLGAERQQKTVRAGFAGIQPIQSQGPTFG